MHQVRQRPNPDNSQPDNESFLLPRYTTIADGRTGWNRQTKDVVLDIFVDHQVRDRHFPRRFVFAKMVGDCRGGGKPSSVTRFICGAGKLLNAKFVRPLRRFVAPSHLRFREDSAGQIIRRWIQPRGITAHLLGFVFRRQFEIHLNLPSRRARDVFFAEKLRLGLVEQILQIELRVRQALTQEVNGMQRAEEFPRQSAIDGDEQQIPRFKIPLSRPAILPVVGVPLAPLGAFRPDRALHNF